MKNKKKMIATLIIILVVTTGISGFVVNAQYQKKQEAIRIAESEAAESRELEESIAEEERLLAEAKEAKLIELQEIEDRVYALYLDETHDFLADGITKEMIDEVNVLIEAQDGKEVYDYSDMLTASTEELSIIQTMFNLQSNVSVLTLEYVLTEEGAAKLEEVQITMAEKVELEDKVVFLESQSNIVNEITAQLTAINDLEARIKTYFTDDELTAVIDTVTREELNELIALKDAVTVESKRLELEATLMTIVNYLDAKDAEALAEAKIEEKASAKPDTSGSNSDSNSSGNNTGSSASSSNNSSNSGSSSSNNNSSSAPATADNSSSPSLSTDKQTSWDLDLNNGTTYGGTGEYGGEFWGVEGGGIVPGGFY